MADKKVIKVVWLCTFSNQKLRSHLNFPRYYWGNIVRTLFGVNRLTDFAVWITNGIHEFEKIPEGIELHVIAPHCGISHLHEFEDSGVFYHVFWSDWDIFIEKIKRKFGIQSINSFRHYRKTITNIIKHIKPDIIHVFGIENKYVSMAVLDLPLGIPVIAQLQTLVSDSRFKQNASSSANVYSFDIDIEKRILLRSDYIGIDSMRYRQIITDKIKPNAVFVDTILCVGESVDFGSEKKLYDFVYFAADISKAADWAIEAFAEAEKQSKGITLNIVGGYSSEYKSELDSRIKELGLTNSVIFEGKLPTHEDVLNQIRKSRFALLPLKIDLVAGTIRESMACGLPVITTITPGTPKLNEKRECVLLSKPGDHKAMASNMLLVINDVRKASELRENSAMYLSERISNIDVVRMWKETYYNCLKSSRAAVSK